MLIRILLLVQQAHHFLVVQVLMRQHHYVLQVGRAQDMVLGVVDGLMVQLCVAVLAVGPDGMVVVVELEELVHIRAVVEVAALMSIQPLVLHRQ